jgi:predicted ABC-type ATPase
MAGPNGSGKSSIINKIRSNFNCGPFVNADEIEKIFSEKGRLQISAYNGLSTSRQSFDAYINEYGKSWMEKAKQGNGGISIKYVEKEGSLVVGNKVNAYPYDAAMAADFIRYQLIEAANTFTIETVLSHPSKIDFLNQSLRKDYKNYLYFICTIDPAINVQRVNQRVESGGHFVPEDKIIKRYYESLSLLPQLLPICHRVYFFDNSKEIEIDKSKPDTMENSSIVAEIDDKGVFKTITPNIPWWLDDYVIKKIT